MKVDRSLVGPWVRRFLLEHLINERNLAANTQLNYRDTFVLLFPFAAKAVKKGVDQLCIDHISPEVTRAFLLYLETDRACSVGTRNQRLAAIHAWARFVGGKCPEYIAWATQICAIPFKKTSHPMRTYLDKPEMDAVLKAPDQNTSKGFRHYALLLFLYNSGARASEAVHVGINDLRLDHSPAVKIMGKGAKQRLCPLWPLTVETLRRAMASRAPADRVFVNYRGQSITRFGIGTIVRTYVRKAAERLPSLLTKRISPHTIRHTTAVHLLRAGVDINTIRAWLGHVSLDTTNIYAEVDLEMKAKAIAHCEIPSTEASSKDWSQDSGLMAFLAKLKLPPA